MRFLDILRSSEIPFAVTCSKLLINSVTDLDDRKVFRRFPLVSTFVLHIDEQTRFEPAYFFSEGELGYALNFLNFKFATAAVLIFHTNNRKSNRYHQNKHALRFFRR